MYSAYTLANKRNGTLYIGFTSNLITRIWQHKNKLVDGFTKKYAIDKLVYYEVGSDRQAVLQKEKQLKKWNRSWKIKLINEKNLEWKDLYDDLIK